MHGAWEIFQCLFFYDMSGFSVWKGALWMLGATGADAVLSVMLVGGALWWRNQNAHLPLTWMLIVAGFIVAAAIETGAFLGGWWHYAAWMPQIHDLGVSLGILPLLQMVLLPCLGAKLAGIPPFAR